MRVSKIRNSPRIVLSAAKTKSELVQDELLLTDTDSDGFSDNYIVSDYLDGELDDGGQRIFAEELAEAEEFLFTPETDTVSTDVVSIENVEAGIMDAGSGRTPDMKIYGTTLVNLLGSYGNFEVDSNSDGIPDDGDGITFFSASPYTDIPLVSGQWSITKTSGALGYFQFTIPIIANHKYFLSFYVKTLAFYTKDVIVWNFSGFSGETYNFLDGIGTSFSRRSKTLTAISTGNGHFQIYARFDEIQTDTITLKQTMFIDLTAAGALDPVRQAKYGVANWADLTEEQLEAEIPYFDSVMSVNVEDGTASELTVENRGKNLFGDFTPDLTGISAISGYGLSPIIDENGLLLTAYTSCGWYKKTKIGETYTLSFNISPTEGATYTENTYVPIVVNDNRITYTTISAKSRTFVATESITKVAIGLSIGTGSLSGNFLFHEFQLEEGTTVTDYVSPREDSITIPDTVELHGYNGVFNYIDDSGNFVKNWEREDKTTDVSGAFALTGYATGSKVICRNKTNGEVEVLDAAASVTTSWTEEDIEILYQLETATLTSESLTGAIKLYQGQNNVLSSDSSAPVAISVVNLNNGVTTSNNIVNIDNIINTASYEWNAGNLTSWSMSGRSFVNLLHDSEEVPDDYSRHFKSIDGNTYFDYLNATIITGDNTYTFVTNTSGDTASMAVYNLTELGNLTSLEADAANTLAEEVLYDTDTLWEDLPEAILTEMLPPYIAQYTKEYTTSYIKPISNTVEHHEIPIDLPLLGLNSYKNVINSDGTGTEYAKISDLSEGSFTHLDEVDDIDYVEIELDYDLSQELEIPEIGVCWDYSSDVSTLTRRVIDTVVETVWNYSSDVSTLSRRAI